jgi:hypothetical protein
MAQIGCPLLSAEDRARAQPIVTDRIEAAVPAGALSHMILDNDGSRNHSKVLKWLARDPRFVLDQNTRADPQQAGSSGCARAPASRSRRCGTEPRRPMSVALAHASRQTGARKSMTTRGGGTTWFACRGIRPHRSPPAGTA